MKNVIMTVIGADRPGLVESLAARVVEEGGNWLESRMSHLGGQLAGMLRVQVSAENAAGLEAALRELEGEGLHILMAVEGDEEVGAASVAAAEQVMAAAILEVMGQDRPGIVRKVMQALASRSVNVEELDTECVSAPMSGEPLFKARARLRVPEDVSFDDLKRELERIAADLMVDISMGVEEA
ncbi:MAG: ACT domain-containing protein [Verrucomicrobiota bacterium]